MALPWRMVPMRAIALPVGWTRISQLSNMPTPRMSHILLGPAPTISVKVQADAHQLAAVGARGGLLRRRPG